MPAHVLHEREALAADVTLVRLLARVGQQVVLEVLSFRRLEAAVGRRGAAVRLAGVDEAVRLQLAAVRRRVAAHVAQVLLNSKRTRRIYTYIYIYV